MIPLKRKRATLLYEAVGTPGMESTPTTSSQNNATGPIQNEPHDHNSEHSGHSSALPSSPPSDFLSSSRISIQSKRLDPASRIDNLHSPERQRPLLAAVSNLASVSDFLSLGVSSSITSSLASMSIKKPTPVQAACIPEMLRGRDCIGNAKTGQGKTVAFAVPILQRLAKDPFGIFALILTPTRELAYQISQQFSIVGAPLDVRVTTVVGGMDMISQMIALNTRPHVVVATPGRLVDILQESNGEWSFSRLKVLILDEADRLLGGSFSKELSAIFKQLPRERQTCLFTATLTPTVEALALGPPKPGKEKPFVYRDSETSDVFTVESLKQQYILCPSHVRETYLYHLLRNPPESILHLRRGKEDSEQKKRKSGDHRKLKKHEVGPIMKNGKKQKVTDDDFNPCQPPPTIIFVQTSHSAAYLECLLKELGFRATSLHSKLSQPERLASLDLFRGFIIPILICTDVGARGLDMDGVGMVINWDLPRNPKEVDVENDPSGTTERAFQTAEEIYLHRVGRTARMGRGGVAISFVTERRWDEPTLGLIETQINTKLTELSMKEDDVLKKINLVSAAKRIATMELERAKFGEKQERHKRVKARKNGR